MLRFCERLHRSGFDYSVILNTNGTLITERLADLFAEHAVDVHVSLDGPDEVSNAGRRNHAGASTLAAARRGIKLLAEADCRIQINTILSQANCEQLESLTGYAAGSGCDRLFVALPDGCNELPETDALARRLLSFDGWARHLLRILGPWKEGLGGIKAATTWPPLNLVVRAANDVFFPHFPDRPQLSLKQAFQPETSAFLAPLWERETSTCRDCVIEQRCRGYLKMMLRYHRVPLIERQMECLLARRVAELAGEPDFEILRTSLDLRLRTETRDRIEIRNALLAEQHALVSRDVLRLLSFFNRGGNVAGLNEQFEAENLVHSIALLRVCHSLLRPLEDSDQLLLSHLTGAERNLPDYNLRLGVADAGQLCRWDTLLDCLCMALKRLPARFSFRETPFCLYGAANSEVMASILGISPENPEMRWMVATVFHSIIVFNLDRCERLLKQAGKVRRESFVRQCAHEFAHLALRQSGVRIPVWLEEGFCEFFSGAPLELDSLRLAWALEPDFRSFLLDTEGAHETNLLSFSDKPVDENPAYHLAHDFVAFLVRREGLNHLLDLLREKGLEAMLHPFPLGSRDGSLLSHPLTTILDAWEVDLHERLDAVATPTALPLRVVVQEKRAILFNRITGGLAWFAEGEALPGTEWQDRNVGIAEAAESWGPIHLQPDLFARWNSGIMASRRGLHLRLLLHDGCNLRCSYCYGPYGGSRAMPVEIAGRSLALWRDWLRPCDEARSSVRLFGGEPLLNWPAIEYILREVAESEATVILNTNGTLLTRAHVAAFDSVRDRVRIALSCDGIGQVHDAERRDCSGRGTFDRVDAAARLVASARIPLCINAVVGSHNLRELTRLADYALMLRDTWHGPVSLGLELRIPAPEEEQVAEACLALLDRCNESDLPVTGNLMHPFEALLDSGGASGFFCAAAGAELCVGPSGEILHCPAVPLPPFSDLAAASMEATLSSSLSWCERRAGALPACRGCEIEGLCGGGCAAQSYAFARDVFAAPSPSFCRVIRQIFRKSLAHLVAKGAHG